MFVNFTKMHSLSNDFVVIDLITQNVRLHTAHIKRIADRHLGIGCDQILLIEPPIHPEADFYYRIYNADGSEVEQCGNGARCAARFFYDVGFSNTLNLRADCLAGRVEFTIENEDSIIMNMGMPRFQPAEIPFEATEEALTYDLSVEENTAEKKIEISLVSMGNPHAVIPVSNLDEVNVKKLGPKIAKHSRFPQHTNVEFMQVLNRDHIRLRVYERGVGETHSCGSGAAGAVVAGIRLGLLNSTVQVTFATGTLRVKWEGLENPVFLTGPAISVYVGRFRL